MTIAEMRAEDAAWVDVRGCGMFQGFLVNRLAADRRRLLKILEAIVKADFPLCGQCPVDVDDSWVGVDVEYCEEHCQSNRGGECWERLFEARVSEKEQWLATRIKEYNQGGGRSEGILGVDSEVIDLRLREAVAEILDTADE